MKILLMIMMFNAIMFCMMKHPLSMGAILLIQTVATSLSTGLLTYHFWFSYIMFLIMVGGMLILFMYMTSIASNEKFKFSWTILSVLTSLMFTAIIIWFFDTMMLSLTFNMSSTKNEMSFSNSLFLNHYMNFPHLNIYILLILYLLITLIAVVKVTSNVKSSIRQKF